MFGFREVRQRVATLSGGAETWIWMGTVSSIYNIFAMNSVRAASYICDDKSFAVTILRVLAQTFFQPNRSRRTSTSPYNCELACSEDPRGDQIYLVELHQPRLAICRRALFDFRVRCSCRLGVDA
jgi:hypothetical protein